MALAYRWTGLPTVLCAETGGVEQPLFDYLSAGAYILLPPSLHPVTGQPYRANCDLLDVLHDLPALPTDFLDALTEELKARGRALRLRAKHLWGPVRR